MAAWRPNGLSAKDAAAWVVVAAAVRNWVEAAAPASCRIAARLLWATARLAIWAYRKRGATDPEVVLHPHNITHFVMHHNKDKTRGWRYTAHSALRRVSRAVCPHLWPPPAPPVRRPSPPKPYSTNEEAFFALAAVMPGRSNRVARMWVVVAALGAGLLGTEIALCGPQHLIPRPGGRVAVQVPGENPRLTMVRGIYTDMALRAAHDCDGDKFLAGGSPDTAASSIAVRIEPDGLCLRRARVTWLAAHMAHTPPAALHLMAGGPGLRSFDDVLSHASTAMTPEEALMLGMGA